MKKAKWITLVLIIIITVSLCFTGCVTTTPETTKAPDNTTASPGVTTTKSALSTTPVTIQFWNSWTGSDAELLKTLVDFYNEKNKDGVTIEMDVVEHDALVEKMSASLASNTAPALYLDLAISDYTVNGQLVPIDDIFEKTSLEKGDFVSAVLDQCSMNGHLYGLPFQISSDYIFWNKDMFKAAGLDPEKAPQTFDELYEYSKKLTDPSKNIYGGGIYYNNMFAFTTTMLSFGGNLVNGETIDTFSSALLDPKYKDGNLAALNWLLKMVDDGCMPLTSGTEEMFLAGTIAIEGTGAWLVGGCKATEDLNWGIGLMPAGPAGRFQSGFPISMVVMKGTEGRELEASYQFMAYWNNNKTPTLQPVGQSPVAQWNKVLGYQPYLNSVASDPEFANDPIAKITNSYVDYIVLDHPAAFYNYLPLEFNVVWPMMENVEYHKMTPEEALADADKTLTSIIESMK